MNKSVSIRKLLGLTQEEMAVALNVSRSHLSHFELDRRKLPKEATQLLKILYNYTKLAWTKRNEYYVAQSQFEKLNKIQSLLRENENQRTMLMPKLHIAERNATQQLTKAHLLKLVLGEDNRLESCWPKELLDILKKTTKTDNENEVYSYQIKMKVLNFEKLKLELLLEIVQKEIIHNT